MPDGYLKFAWEHISPILVGEKTATVRHDLERRIDRGDRIRLCDPDGATFATARVVRSEMGPLSAALGAIQGAQGEYPVEDTYELMYRLATHYDRAFQPDDIVHVLVWEDVEKEYGHA